MEIPYTTEWWRWKIYRRIAEYLHDPSFQGQMGIHAMLQAYREQQQSDTATAHQDEHEWGLNWR